jgi:hypothetical protein
LKGKIYVDGYKEIIITREKSMWGCAVDFTVLLDGKVVGTLRNGDTISVYTQDGPHTLLFQKGKKIDCSVSILISPEDKVWVVNTEISGSHLAVDSQYASNTTEATAFDRENSPRKQAKRSKGNVAFAVVIVVAALAALSLTFKGHSDNSSNDRPSPHQSNISTQLDNNLTPDSQPEEITISATDLWAAYKENTVNADALYKDKILVVTGTIQNIGQDIVTKAPCISIETNDGYGLYPIQCFFPKNGDQTDLIAQLKDGDQIVIAGKCDGIPLAQVQLTKCSIR